MNRQWVAAFLAFWIVFARGPVHATDREPADPVLAAKLGTDERGMRKYVLAILESGPNRVPQGQERTDMFKGHFANMERLAEEQKLAVAGPFAGGSDWRGMFGLAVVPPPRGRGCRRDGPEHSKREMVAKYHPLRASASLMAVNGIHGRISPR